MAETIRLASEIQTDSIVDGEGIRTVIWTQGCSHDCKGCHNPETHDFKKGFVKKIDDLKKEIDLLSKRYEEAKKEKNEKAITNKLLNDFKNQSLRKMPI